MNRLLLAALLASLGLTACGNKEEAAAPKAEAPKAEPAQAAEPETYAPNTGKLVQTLEAGGYTYAEIAGPQDQRVWLAGGKADVKPGDMVQWGQFAVMRNFTAKSLNRTFDQILFVNSWGPLGGAQTEVAAHGTAPGTQAAAAPHAAMGAHGGAGIQPQAAPERTGVVKSSTTAAGYTYLEVTQGDSTTWVAAPEAQVKEGDTVTWGPGMVMRNFTAKSIDRTFDQIVFSGGVSKVQ